MARTVHTNLHELQTKRLGSMVTTSTIHAQLMAQLHNKESSIRTPHGTCPMRPSNYTHGKSPISQRPPSAHQRSMETGTRSHQTLTRSDDLKTHMLCALLCGRQSMVRRQKSHHHTPHQQEHRLLPDSLLVPSRKVVQVAQVHKSNVGLLFNINFNNINLFD